MLDLFFSHDEFWDTFFLKYTMLPFDAALVGFPLFSTKQVYT